MNTSPRTCRVENCDEPVKVFPSRPGGNLCARHWSEASQRNKKRPAIDPVTGEAITVGVLASRTWYRRRKAARAEATA